MKKTVNFNFIQPVQMIPLRRCGSHAIRLRLSKNPHFYSPYPLHLADFMPLLKGYGNLNNDRAYFQLITDLVGLQAVSMVKWPDIALDPIQIFERIQIKPRSIHTIAWEMLFIAAEAKGASVVMDKSLDNVYEWKSLLELHPNMLFINLVRDPRAQVSSINRAIIHHFDTLLNAKLVMQNYQASFDLIKKYPKRVITIKFEDFISSPETEMKKLCEFLGLGFNSSMLDVSTLSEAQRISKQSALWESNSSPPMIHNIDKFKKSLSIEEIEIIETICNKVMDRYGYAKMTPGKAKITQTLIEKAHKNSLRLKKQAWRQLELERPQDFVLRKKRIDYIGMCLMQLKKLNFE
jgi:hypothetical protein